MAHERGLPMDIPEHVLLCALAHGHCTVHTGNIYRHCTGAKSVAPSALTRHHVGEHGNLGVEGLRKRQKTTGAVHCSCLTRPCIPFKHILVEYAYLIDWN